MDRFYLTTDQQDKERQINKRNWFSVAQQAVNVCWVFTVCLWSYTQMHDGQPDGSGKSRPQCSHCLYSDHDIIVRISCLGKNSAYLYEQRNLLQSELHCKWASRVNLTITKFLYADCCRLF